MLDRLDAETVINCAAYTQVDQAEDEEDLATTINGAAVGVIAKWCAERERRLLTFSSDYVFDGQAEEPYVESSQTSPLNAYGRSKLVGERLALEHGGMVVRSSWVISGSHPNFVATMIRLAADRELNVVDDQFGCPTIAHDLAVAGLDALSRGVGGLLHRTNQGATTWYRLAEAAIREAGLSTNRLHPVTTAEYPTKVARPAYSVLASERLAELGIEPLPPWEDSLPGVVAEIMTWI